MTVSLVLDTGALIAYERGDEDVASMVDTAYEDDRPVVTSSGCVAQAWRRGGPRQARLAILLQHAEEVALGPGSSRIVGALCNVSRTSDVVDAHVALLARDGDTLVTSDPGDLGRLLDATKAKVRLTAC